MCQFNCVPISSPKLFTYSLSQHCEAPIVPRWLIVWLEWKCVCLGHNLTWTGEIRLKGKHQPSDHWSLQRFYSTVCGVPRSPRKLRSPQLLPISSCLLYSVAQCYLKFQHSAAVKLDGSWTRTDIESKPKDIPRWNLPKQNICREKWFCVSAWLFTTPPTFFPSRNYWAMSLLAWGPFRVGWLGMKSDWHNSPLP